MYSYLGRKLRAPFKDIDIQGTIRRYASKIPDINFVKGHLDRHPELPRYGASGYTEDGSIRISCIGEDSSVSMAAGALMVSCMVTDGAHVTLGPGAVVIGCVFRRGDISVASNAVMVCCELCPRLIGQDKVRFCIPDDALLMRTTLGSTPDGELTLGRGCILFGVRIAMYDEACISIGAGTLIAEASWTMFAKTRLSIGNNCTIAWRGTYPQTYAAKLRRIVQELLSVDVNWVPSPNGAAGSVDIQLAGIQDIAGSLEIGDDCVLSVGNLSVHDEASVKIGVGSKVIATSCNFSKGSVICLGKGATMTGYCIQVDKSRFSKVRKKHTPHESVDVKDGAVLFLNADDASRIVDVVVQSVEDNTWP